VSKLAFLVFTVLFAVLGLSGCGGVGSGVGSTTSAPGTTPPADTTRPSTPTGVAAAAAGSTAINLSWNPATDNVGVTGYVVNRNGTQVGTPVTTSYSDTGLSTGTTYSYTVAARDAAGNNSFLSSSANATTTGTADTTRPSTPTGVTAAATGASRIDLSWSASNDNVGVVGYRLERCEGPACVNFTQIAAPTGLTHNDTSALAPSTTYRYQVRAADGAGNFSGYSLIVSATTQVATGTQLPLGALAHDGPATPEQISLLLPVTGSLPQTATAVVRYKPTSSSTWKIGHPLYRIRPTLSDTPAFGSVEDAFAWPIIDLVPGTSYDVEVTVNSGAVTNVKTLTHTTRALPAAAPAVNKTITTGSSATTIQTALNNLNPGDVIQFQNGIYNLATRLVLNRSGTLNNPIYIRGASRTGVVLSNAGLVFEIQDASHIIIENMTLRGSSVDSGPSAGSVGIQFPDGAPPSSRITVRNVTINGVDRGILARRDISEFLAYDNTLTGNNTWSAALLDTNATWNDDGINIPGFGNCAFNNTLNGFGDSFAFSAPGALTQAVGIHFYRNDVRNSGDDFTEADYSIRNNTLYDNRSHNSMTFVSLDPLYGGPLVVARNIVINIGRTPFKWNSTNSGQFIYNNTILRTTGQKWLIGEFSAEAGWYQPNNGDQSSYGYRNNILVYRGASNQTIRLDNSGHDPVDFTHNSWFPNQIFQWPQGTFSNLTAAYNGLSATTPVFSGVTRRHEQDNITVSNPWTVPIVLGTDFYTEVTTFTPILSPGTAPKNSGVVIPNITDDFSTTAPDRGAIIEGRSIPTYGDRSSP